MKKQTVKRININLTIAELTVIEELLKDQEHLNRTMGNPPYTKNNASDIVRFAICQLGYGEGLGDKMIKAEFGDDNLPF